MSERKAVILSSVRTGSTWLGETLAQHPAVTYDEELLLEASTVESGMGHHFDAEVALNYVQAFADAAPTSWHLWKCQGYQALNERLIEPASKPCFLERLANNRSLAVIFLRRLNLFHWFVSIKVSEQLKVYTKRIGDEIPEVEPFEIDADEIEHYMRKELAWWEIVQGGFSDRPRFAVTTYEAMCQDYDGEAARIMQSLDLNPVSVKTTTLKMQTRDPKRQVTNYDELVSRFQGTDLADYGFM